jgi:Ca2+-transporting ATPase
MEERELTMYAPYTQTVEAVEQEIGATPEGLNKAQVDERLEKYGLNALEAGKSRTLRAKILDQFKDFMIIVLLVAAVISGFVAHEWTDAAIILIVVVLNAIFGVYQEGKAEAAIDALKEMATPHAKVRRGGQVENINSHYLVPGDVVLLEAGDIVPADLRLFEIQNIKIEEASLTGESVPVEKHLALLESPDTPIGDRLNMAYQNSSVTYGRARGYVVATGMDTEVGKIASMISEAEETQTPLKANLNKLGKFLTWAILVIAAIILAMLIFQHGTGKESILNAVMTAIALAVAAIPEGLPAIVTIVLALGTKKMADRNAIVRKLPAVETLGSTDIICSDKTGTLTLNKMTVEALAYAGKIHDASDSIDPNALIIKIMAANNDTNYSADGTLIGDPTETALSSFARKKGFNLQNYLEVAPRVAELPFDSARKLMTTVHKIGEREYKVFVKGALDMIAERCTTSYNEAGADLRIFADTAAGIEQANHQLAQQALRVLAFAFKVIDHLPTEEEMTSEFLETDLTFVGLVGMIDPARPEARDAVAQAKKAGVRPIMITGDHADTARAIAIRLGIIDEKDTDGIITGRELDLIEHDEFAERIPQFSVYARVSPEHKVRIVRAWQKREKVVAMTGDGVNDAPALKQADIGIGMGITGTEVSKGASDVVLADDNFATIVVAIEEGRKVFANIQKTIQYLVSANLGEVITLFVATLLGWLTLMPVQLLWINLVTDTFPAIALGVEPAEPNVMSQKPRGKRANFFSGGVLGNIIYQGILQGGLTLGIYAAALHWPDHATDAALAHQDALTMAFITLGLIQLFHAFNVKSINESIFAVGAFKNKMFNGGILISFILLVSTVTVPFMRDIFHVSDLTGHQWGLVFLFSASIVVFVEIVKFIKRQVLKNA